MAPATMSRPGLRERKKQRTREALVDAALDLFGQQGFEATTVDEIAEAVEVSPRTFFRYFGAKEDVVISVMEQQWQDVYEELDRRPRDEPVLTALRRAALEVLRRYEQGRASSQFSCLIQLVQDSPSVLARSLELCSKQNDDLARRIAARMGVDPVADPRPMLVAAVGATAIQVAIRAWREHEPQRSVSELTERAFDLLEAGINYPPSAS